MKEDRATILGSLESTEMGLNPALLPAEAEEIQQGKPEAALSFLFVSNCAPYHSQDQLLLLIKAVMFPTLSSAL